MNSNEMCGCGTEEKTNTAKGLVKINYKEDFELVVELLAGDKPYKLGDEDFRIDFIVMASHYTVGRTGGVCERCSVDGNKIRCFMDGHGLPPGELRAEVKVNTPDPNYADGSRLNVAIAEGMVVLVKDNTRFDGAVVKANIPVALVDAYHLAKAHGYKGTIDEYYATFNEIGQLKESIKGTLDEMTKAEKLRATAETERAKAETERQWKQDRFNTAESERLKNEQQRQAAEGQRQRAERDRATAESNRASAEEQRTKAEQLRNNTEQARQTAESQRAKDELVRVGSESERAKAETQRQTAEELRKQAETKRVNAEEKRMSLEKERSTIFSSMQENIGSKIKDVNAATSDLKSIIGMDKGVFASIDALQSAYPSPQVGYSAKVGTELPYTIYVCEKAGTWKDSGAKYTPTTQVPTIEQTTGKSETSVMSQKAVTEAITNSVEILKSDFVDILTDTFIPAGTYSTDSAKGYRTTAEIDLSKYSKVSAFGASKVSFSDVEKKYISQIRSNNETGWFTPTIPPNAKFAMFMWSNTNSAEAHIKAISKLQDIVSELGEKVNNGNIDITIKGVRTAKKGLENDGTMTGYNKNYRGVESYLNTFDAKKVFCELVPNTGQTASFAFYDKDFTLISKTNIGKQAEIPSGAVYFRMGLGAFVTYEKCDYTLIGVPLSRWQIVAEMAEKLQETNKKILYTFLDGKTVGFLGDSITNVTPYAQKFCEMVGATAHVFGTNGATLGKIEGTSRATIQDNVGKLTGDESLVVIFGGSNDHGAGTVLGDMFGDYDVNGYLQKNPDSTTFCGGLEKIIEDTMKKCPNAQLMLMTPLHKNDKGGGAYWGGSSISSIEKNSQGLLQKSYVDAIKEIGAFYSIPVLDLYSISNLDFNHMADYTVYAADGLHQTSEPGYMKIAKLMYKFVQQYIF